MGRILTAHTVVYYVLLALWYYLYGVVGKVDLGLIIRGA